MIAPGEAERDSGREQSPLQRWNTLPASEAATRLLVCCGSRRWAQALTASRPYETSAALIRAAEETWFLLSEADWLEAFACHPRIGERKAPTTEYLVHSGDEQAIAQRTLGDVADALLAGHRAYEEKFGFLYIVFASGRSAPELLAVLNARLTHTREQELHEAARQQHRITALRMTKWLHPEGI